MNYSIKILSILIIVVTLVYFVPIPNDGQVNFKTGTMRYRFLGIPISYRELPRYKVEWTSLGLRDSWGTVVEYPLKSSNNTDAMVRNLMYRISVWSIYDKDIAKVLADDLVEYIITTKCRSGLPKYSIYTSPFIVDIPNSKLKYDPDIIDLGNKDPNVIKLNNILRNQLTKQ